MLSDADIFAKVKVLRYFAHVKKKLKPVPVTGRERSRLPHLLDSQLTDGSKVVNLTHQAPFTPQESSWYSFLLEAE
jgi:hypothetical protein